MIKSKRTVPLAVLVAGLCLAGEPANAEELADANALVLADPGSVELNLHYALIAEGQGKYRLALAAYERILLNHPDNREAKRGLVRVRRILQPPETHKFIETGVKAESNADHVADPGAFDFLGFGALRIRDERAFGDRRWRTTGSIYGEVHSEAESLNYATAYGTFGPIFDLGASLVSVNPAIGGGVAMLDGEFYYADINAGATFEGYLQGAYQRARLRVGYRQYNEDMTSDNGLYVDATARFAKANVFAENDSVSFSPIIRWNDIDGTFNDGVSDFSPGKYLYGGARLAYHLRLTDVVTVGAGIGVYDRYFPDDQAPDGDNRQDITVRPGTSVLVKDVFGPQTGVRFEYDYEHNDSNDPDHDYDNHIFGLSVVVSR